MDFESLLAQHKLQIILGIFGIILLGIGIVLFFPQQQPEIEILPASPRLNGGQAAGATIFVDIEGAVQNPGVYELPAGSLLNDLLIRAGGLAASADRQWAAKNLNLAQKLVDSSKFFIPERSLAGQSPSEAGPSSGQLAATQTSAKININTASVAELDTLWGIGEKRAQGIIDNRPYQSVEELLTRKVIPQNVYERIKNEVVVY